jgi:hypothetical protein
MHEANALSGYFKKLEETHRAVEVLRPAWNQKQAVLESTIDYVKNISEVRIHVERAIQRIKTFHILDGEEKLSIKNIAEQIFTICAYLVNLQNPIVKRIKSLT